MTVLVIQRFSRAVSFRRSTHRQHKTGHDSSNCERCGYGSGTPCYLTRNNEENDEEEWQDDEDDFQDLFNDWGCRNEYGYDDEDSQYSDYTACSRTVDLGKAMATTMKTATTTIMTCT